MKVDPKEFHKKYQKRILNLASTRDYFPFCDDLFNFAPFFNGNHELGREFIVRWFKSFDRHKKAPAPKMVKRIVVNLVGEKVYKGVREKGLAFFKKTLQQERHGPNRQKTQTAGTLGKVGASGTTGRTK